MGFRADGLAALLQIREEELHWIAPRVIRDIAEEVDVVVHCQCLDGRGEVGGGVVHEDDDFPRRLLLGDLLFRFLPERRLSDDGLSELIAKIAHPFFTISAL